MNASTTHGGCLCGKVRFTVEGEVGDVSICHCEMCRRWNSGPMMAIHPKHGVDIEGEDNVGWYDSSDWAARGFCKHCGTSLFYKLKGELPQFIVAAGAFDDQTGFKVGQQIFIDEKPSFYDFSGDIPAMTGAEVFAMYAPEAGEPED